MKSFKIVILMMIIFLNIFISTSCWNYKEIGDKAIVAGAAVDYDSNTDRVILTVEIVTPTNKGQETIIESEILQESGINLFDAARNLVSIAGKSLFWSHTKIFILSEDLLREDEKFISVIDALKRDAEIRDDMHILISKEKTAGEILQKSEIEIETIKSFFIEDILKNEKAISKYQTKPLWKFIDELGSEGISSTLPTIHLEQNKGKHSIEVYGLEAFKGEKIVGWLDPIEAKTFLFIMDEIKGGIIVIDEKFGEHPIRVSLEIYNNKTKVTPQNNDELIMKIDIETKVSIAEIGGEVDVIKEDQREKLRRDAEELIKKRVTNLIKKAQKEYKSDIFGFGSIVKKEEPKLWKKIGKEWDKRFENLQTEVNVKFQITGSALRSKPIKVGE